MVAMQNQFIAVDESASREAGAIAYFRSSGTTTEKDLVDACNMVGLPTSELPKLPSAEVALHRAVEEQREKRRLVRPLEGGGWSIVDEHLDDDGNIKGYSLALTVRLMPSKDLAFIPEGHGLCAEISAAYVQHKNQHSATDINTWLIKLAEGHHAVSPRDRGGFYFIPRQTLDAFKQWASMLHSSLPDGRKVSGSHVFFIPAMKSDEAIESILDAISREAEAEAEGMEKELDEQAEIEASEDTTRKKMGKRALNSRLTRLSALGKKMSTYEALLGVKLEDLRSRLDQVKANLTVAAIAVDAEADAEARR